LEDIDAAVLARLDGDVPFEFVGQVARACALTEAGHVEGGAAAARHCRWCWCEREGDGMAVVVLLVLLGAAEWQMGRRRAGSRLESRWRNRFQSASRKEPRLLLESCSFLQTSATIVLRKR
jgi:hypothetical protein